MKVPWYVPTTTFAMALLYLGAAVLAKRHGRPWLSRAGLGLLMLASTIYTVF